MPKFLVQYVVPAKVRKRILEVASPEIAAQFVRNDNSGGVENVLVQELGVDEEDMADKEVYEWCENCGLPIWIDDDRDSYRMLSEEGDMWTHRACEAAKEKDHG